MTRAQKIALVVDFLRSKGFDASGWINDAITLAHKPANDAEDQALLDTMEALNAEAIGNIMIDRMIETYLDQAIEWRDERRAA